MNIPWSIQALMWHRVGLIILLSGAVILSQLALIQIGQEQLLALCMIIIGVTGLSHGAVDHILASRSDGIKNKAGFGFYILYCGLALLALWFWSVLPVVSLIIFLLVSIIHFGESDSLSRNVSGRIYFAEVAIRGALPVLLPCLFKSDEVAKLFVFLGCDLTSAQVHQASLITVQFLAIPAVVALGFAVLHWYTTRSQELVLSLLECVAITLSSATLPALLSFTIYFCFVHSFRQVIQLAFFLDPEAPKKGFRQFFVLSWPLTVVSIFACSIVLVFQSMIVDQYAAQVRCLFYSLSGLTIPHMLFWFTKNTVKPTLSEFRRSFS